MNSIVISEILNMLIAGVIILSFLGLLAASIIGCFLLLSPLLKKHPNLHHLREYKTVRYSKSKKLQNMKD